MISNNFKWLQHEVSLGLLNKVSLFVDGNYRGLVLRRSLMLGGVWNLLFEGKYLTTIFVVNTAYTEAIHPPPISLLSS